MLKINSKLAINEEGNLIKNAYDFSYEVITDIYMKDLQGDINKVISYLSELQSRYSQEYSVLEIKDMSSRSWDGNYEQPDFSLVGKK
jgi:hypothetical protein